MTRTLPPVALLTALLVAPTAEAATIGWDIEVFDLDGPLASQRFHGMVFVDDSFIDTGTQILGPDNSDLTLMFDFVDPDLTTPRRYTETDDVDFNDFPELMLVDGVAVALDYVVFHDNVFESFFTFDENSDAFSHFPAFETEEPEGVGTYTLTPKVIAEPATLILLGTGFGLVACRRRRKS